MSSVVLTSLSGTSTGAASLVAGIPVANQEVILATCFLPAGQFRDIGDLKFEIAGLIGTATGSNVLTFQFYQDTKPGLVVAGVSSGTALLTLPTTAVTTGTWTVATKTITQVAAFTNYIFVAGDTFVVVSGTGATPGTYVVASKTSSDAITLTTNVAAGDLATGDIVGSVVQGTAPNFTIVPTTLSAWRAEFTLSINDQATTTSRMLMKGQFFFNPAFSDATAATTTLQNSLRSGTVSPNVGTFGVDTYVWCTVKASIAIPTTFTVKSARIYATGVRSQGSIEGEV